MLEQFQEMRDGYLGKIITSTHKVALFSPEARQIHSVPFCAGSYEAV